MAVGGLALKRITTVRALDAFSVDDNGWADLDLDVLFFLNAVDRDFKVEFTHTSEQCFTGLLVGGDLGAKRRPWPMNEERQ